MEDLIAIHGLDAFRDVLSACSLPCIVGRAAAASEAAGSWLGGYPMIDDGFVWPIKDDRPLGFVGQLLCQDIGMDRAGYLLFFYDEEHHGFALSDAGGFAVVHQHGERLLEEADLPVVHSKTLGLFRRASRPKVWARTPIVFDAGLSYDGDAAYEALNYELDDADRLFAFCADAVHHIQVAGIASPANTDYQSDACVVCAEMLGVEPSDCVLLLQLHSAHGMMWGDVGSLCWYIRRADLAAGNFTDAWMLMTCS